ncbi:TonB-dependent receptor [Arcticibacter tournemirensis]|uniref:TonB-dependent receptor n=1 Tax=Arcticibacter tournemirensis TaxID=699437 RepID=A0A5M9HEC4_9SPHI|nr:TonB-dependent receptor [Arcticibacter tournemirensis]KAA8485053.1 TonB-dependent receptor [Arcticibacter tournemirensis]
MKLFFFAIFLSVCIANAATSYGQLISLKEKDRRVEDVLKKIEEQTGYTFFYNTKQFDINRKINLTVDRKDVFKVLDDLFRGTRISYTVLNKSIILSNLHYADAERSGAVSEQAFQDKVIKGIVTDSKGEPVIGATVRIEGSAKGTSTDMNGRFTITANIGAILKITYMGFLPVEIPVTRDIPALLRTELREDLRQLDEVVVVGYGVQRKSDVTGAISSVSSKKLNTIPSTSLGEMLRGNAAGVQVTMSNAAPGGSSSILIRGRRSLSGDNAPLFIVDGVPMASIDDVNSNDVQSVEVLKDASAQSIYGARAANGVILVTTKRGVSGKAKVSYSGYAASQSLNRNFEFYNGEEWAAYRKEAFYNANGYYDETEAFRGLMLDALKSGEWVDWEKLMLNPAWQHKHDVFIQSGNDKTKYALGLGYFSQDGMVLNSDFERLTGRLNVDQKLSKNVTVGSNISFMKSWKNTADGTFNSFITMPPLAKVYNDDGSLREDVTEAGESHYNPLWNINNSENKSETERLLINVFADIALAKGTSYRANASISNRTVHGNTYQGVNHTTGRNNDGRATVSTSFANDYLFENIFNFKKDFGKVHQLDATLMQSVNVIKWKNIGLNGTGFPNDDLSYNGIGSASEYGSPSWELSDRKLLSYLGRLRYNFMGKYLFTAAMRIDGSSVFGKNNKYGYFPSAAFAWRVKEEPFLKESVWISNLKLRLSYGQVGNQGVTPYTTLGLADKYLTEFGNSTAIGYLPGSDLWNPNLKWETSTSANAGLDFGFLRERISGAFEFYDTQTTDLLVSRSLSRTSGYANQMVNLGHVQNRGVELSLNSVVVDSKSFSWNVNLSYTQNWNKIKKINGEVDNTGKPKDDINNNWFIGSPINVYYDYAFDGIWQKDVDIASSYMPAATPGSIRVKDVNGDHQISADDRIIMQRDPEWIGTLGTTLNWKAFDLAADLLVSQGGIIYNPYLATFETGGDMTGKRNGIRRNYWTLNNPSNEAPAPNMTQQPAYIGALAYEDASYIRLRNVTLGFNVPVTFARKLRTESIRIYSTLTNFWTKSDVHAYGPEQNPGDYPEPKTLLFGLNVSF